MNSSVAGCVVDLERSLSELNAQLDNASVTSSQYDEKPAAVSVERKRQLLKEAFKNAK